MGDTVPYHVKETSTLRQTLETFWFFAQYGLAGVGLVFFIVLETVLRGR